MSVCTSIRSSFISPSVAVTSMSSGDLIKDLDSQAFATEQKIRKNAEISRNEAEVARDVAIDVRTHIVLAGPNQLDVHSCTKYPLGIEYIHLPVLLGKL